MTAALRRFEEHTKVGKPYVLAENHPAVIEGRSLFTKPAGNHGTRILVSGFNSKKIGKRVIKGRWAGMPIFTLTLEERKTCPASCVLWRSCYGNRMHWSRRNQAGPELETKLNFELAELQTKHPKGFVVRLHILGDFYSVGYVQRWETWLDAYPALHVFGYTARQENDPIGQKLRELIRRRWRRFAVRSSGGYLGGWYGRVIPKTVVVPTEADAPAGSIVCPAQTQRSDCCGTCTLCWETEKPITFLEH
jgi:hypothetical protein